MTQLGFDKTTSEERNSISFGCRSIGEAPIYQDFFKNSNLSQVVGNRRICYV